MLVSLAGLEKERYSAVRPVRRDGDATDGHIVDVSSGSGASGQSPEGNVLRARGIFKGGSVNFRNVVESGHHIYSLKP
jgi:hypothetical protein